MARAGRHHVMRRVTRCVAGGLHLALALAVVACTRSDTQTTLNGSGLMRLAVIGNSDSHAYHDSIAFPPGTPLRGGARHAATFQWTEVLHALRGREIDQGPWGERGRSARGARILGMVGIAVRRPRKQDFEYNVAYSGARCSDLAGPQGQVAQLRRAIDADAAAWGGGVVLFRIGINDIGRREVLDEVARTGMTDAHRQLVRACTDAIIDAVRGFRGAHEQLHFVLVGIADNANWPPNFDAFRDAEALRRLDAMHDAYDDALRTFASTTPGVAFFDDRSWLRERWGSRDADGAPAYRPYPVAGVPVALVQGDEAASAYVADGHANTMVNALWAQSLARFLVERFGAPLTPVTDDELAAFLRPLVAP